MRTLIFRAPGAPTVPLGRAPTGQGPLRVDAQLIQRWLQHPRVPKRAKGDLLPCVRLLEALPSRRFLPSPTPQALPATFLKSMEIPGHTSTQRTQAGGSFWSVWGCAGGVKDSWETLLWNRKHRTWGYPAHTGPVKNVGVHLAAPRCALSPAFRRAAGGARSQVYSQANPPPREGTRGHEATEASRLHPSYFPSAAAVTVMMGMTALQTEPRPTPAWLAPAAQAAKTSLGPESRDTRPARGTHSPLWGQEGGRLAPLRA